MTRFTLLLATLVLFTGFAPVDPGSADYAADHSSVASLMVNPLAPVAFGDCADQVRCGPMFSYHKLPAGGTEFGYPHDCYEPQYHGGPLCGEDDGGGEEEGGEGDGHVFNVEDLLKMDRSDYRHLLAIPNTNVAYNADRKAIQLMNPCGASVILSIPLTEWEALVASQTVRTTSVRWAAVGQRQPSFMGE